MDLNGLLQAREYAALRAVAEDMDMSPEAVWAACKGDVGKLMKAWARVRKRDNERARGRRRGPVTRVGVWRAPEPTTEERCRENENYWDVARELSTGQALEPVHELYPNPSARLGAQVYEETARKTDEVLF